MLDKTKRICIGSDHAGFETKKHIINYLDSEGIAYDDFGCYSSESVDYPDVAHKLAYKVSVGEYEKGILVCGSGNGVCMTANKYINVRAALVWSNEITELARLHNDANILCIPGRFVSNDEAVDFVKIFFSTQFEGGRHERRVEKIKNDFIK
ncbi:MAG: ribose 5-phosphate isomerase B [Bacteroidales bacterium]|jgi:ribose 5-phosphate isomerase B